MAKNIAEFSKKFFAEIESQGTKIAQENEALNDESKSKEQQSTKEEAEFRKRLDEERKKDLADKKCLENEIMMMKTLNDSLRKRKEDCQAELDTFHEDFMSQFDDEDTLEVEKEFGDIYDSLLKSLDDLSFQTMNDRLILVKNHLKGLYTEEKRLEKSISIQQNSIKDVEKELTSSYGVNYQERNALRFSLIFQVNKVRQLYKKSRLMEESLKAKLST